MCELNKLKIGQGGILKKIEDDLEIKKRLLDIGFTKGSKVECLRKGFLNGPVAYKIKNSVIALRDTDAKKIYVEESYEF